MSDSDLFDFDGESLDEDDILAPDSQRQQSLQPEQCSADDERDLGNEIPRWCQDLNATQVNQDKDQQDTPHRPRKGRKHPHICSSSSSSGSSDDDS